VARHILIRTHTALVSHLLAADVGGMSCYHLVMAKTVTLRLSDSAYEAVKQYAEADQKSMNAWIETVLDAEDMRRRCEAHDQWMRERPHVGAFSEAWADRNLDELTKR